ncbi:SDR family NAD(P)-dependent oxidoreductase [Dyadobacter fanqingshengii]|uniref:3-oxoacyl-ACP reductase FabG n=1 Tax=Dyadobacter fanqingshengii TaxID=2906443 RepID=A0A9X1T9D0_9BACT|nr:3-oxoacyl-ACP reductase family protein [Dyadobacter fanqingshengii]MCF0040581.1 3-oxoacyl-ACP reductase FabG [Dyadobacter fanqingshengii]USJ37681.1 3-oxoacyl-ACP reductase FabG [Dyadobacter fanqingshengii]
MQNLKNKVAFVTGGSRGIGAGIVKRLAADGAKVAFTYVNGREKADALVAELAEKGFTVIALQANNAQEGAVTAAIDEAIAHFGQLDILVNSAGIYVGKPFEEHTLADYNEIMDINVKSVFEACLAAARKMENNGRIITIGSNMAERSASVQSTLYSMSKSALVGFTKGLSRDLGAKDITVNLIQPGPVDTDMNPSDPGNNESSDFQRSMMAIPRYGKPEHIAATVAFLADPDNGYTTGSIITIDGGTLA